jgi:dCMP deaminase
MMIEKWHRRFIELATLISSWSKDPSTKVGAVIVDRERRVVSVGYNGLPRGVLDSLDRLGNRDVKYRMVVHAERNALLFAQEPLHGCILYTWPFAPCSVCAGMVIQSGITHVVAPRSTNPRWVDDFALTEQMFTEAGVELMLLDGYEDEPEV